MIFGHLVYWISPLVGCSLIHVRAHTKLHRRIDEMRRAIFRRWQKEPKRERERERERERSERFPSGRRVTGALWADAVLF
jgi:hypothetical protein